MSRSGRRPFWGFCTSFLRGRGRREQLGAEKESGSDGSSFFNFSQKIRDRPLERNKQRHLLLHDVIHFCCNKNAKKKRPIFRIGLLATTVPLLQIAARTDTPSRT